MRPVEIANVCHEANRVLQQLAGDTDVNPEWADAPEWMQESAVEGVINALDGVTPEQLHIDWMRSRTDAGWVYGPIKSAEAKTHPCLVRYDQLSEIDRAKDAVFLAIVHALKDVAR